MKKVFSKDGTTIAYDQVGKGSALILAALTSVGEIAERLGLNQPKASKHLHVLSVAGLVEVDAIANRRIYIL